MHAHSHSTSLELQDITAGERVFLSRHRNHADRVGIEWLDYYSSEEGIAVYADHDYQLISTYTNPTESDADAMAVMFLYYLDRKFAPSSL